MRSIYATIVKSYRDKRIRYSVLAAIVIASIALFQMKDTASDDIIWVDVSTDGLTVELIESGEIRAVESEFVRAPRAWRMDLQIIDLVPEGTMVEKGDFLAQFDTTTLDEEMTQMLERLKQAEADLKSEDTQQASRRADLQTNLKIAEYSKEAMNLKSELLKFESENMKEDAILDLKKEELRYEESKEKIETQKILDTTDRQKVLARLQNEQGHIEHVKRSIEELTLRAPIAGMVVYQEVGGRGPDNPRYKVTIGDKVDSGSRLISIPNLNKMKMTVKLSEIDADKIKIGDKVSISLDAYIDARYNGTVTHLSTMLEKEGNRWEPIQKAATYDLTILIDETDEKLKPGMTARGVITLEEITGVITIPTGAVFEDQNGNTVVYTKKSSTEPVPVKLGGRNDRFVIVESGLQKNDQVSLTAPVNESNPLGWYAEMERRKKEFQETLSHIETMNERGLTFDPSKQDSLEKNIAPPMIPSSGGAPVIRTMTN